MIHGCYFTVNLGDTSISTRNKNKIGLENPKRKVARAKERVKDQYLAGLTPMSQQIYCPIYIINKSMVKISNWSLELLRCFFFYRLLMKLRVLVKKNKKFRSL